MSRDAIARRVDERGADCRGLSDRIWPMPELAFEEHQAVRERIAMLEAEGFRIARDPGGMAAASPAEAGSGGPDDLRARAA